MADEEIEKGLAELKAWTEQRYGRALRVARLLGVSPQLMSGWYVGRSAPKLKAWLQMQNFLRKSDRARRQAIGEE